MDRRLLCAWEDRLAERYFEEVQYTVGVPDLAQADEHIALVSEPRLIYFSNDTMKDSLG